MPDQLTLFDDPSFYESSDLEFKSAKGGLPASFWETYSAFANTDGGVVYLGIAELNGGGLDFHGVANADRMKADLFSAVNNRGKVSCNLLQEDDVQVVTVSGTDNIVRIAVRRASRYERPVFLNNDPFGSTFRRGHSGDYRCSPDDVRRMFADQSPEAADSRLLRGFDEGDLHTPTIQQYRQRFASVRPNHPWLVEDDLSLLSKLGGWRKDRISGEEGLTVAGLLMFGKESSIRAPEGLPQYHLDYRERFSEDRGERWSDRLTLDGTWEGNLFQFYIKVMPRIANTLASPFRLDKDLYRYDESSVGEALREGVVNAIIHGDYMGQGGVVLDRYPDRIELSNPGTLLVSHEQLQRGGISECRNKALQTMFQFMGAGDKAGSGLDKIRTSWADARLRSPTLHETQRPDRVRLLLPLISILPETAIAKLRSQFGLKCDELRPEEVQILVLAVDEGTVSNQRLQEDLTIHRTDLTKLLQHLVREGFLVRSGFGRWTIYELPKPGIAAANDLEPVGSSVATSVGSSVGTSVGSYDDQSGKNRRADEGDRSPLLETNPTLWAKLLEIGQPARNNPFLRGTQFDGLVINLCREAGWLTRDELSVLLSRSGFHLRDRVLNRLITTGHLRRRYENKNHPHQAYSV